MTTLSQEYYYKENEKNEENEIYNAHFHTIHLADGMNPDSFIYDDMRQVFYPRSPGIFNIKERCIFAMFDAFTTVIPYDKKRYDEVMGRIMSNPGNTFLNTNHATFFNIPLAVRELHRYVHALHCKAKKEHIFTILAPSITTQSQKHLGNAISHFLKTFTINPRSQVEGLKQEIQEIRDAFKGEVNFYAEQQGNIFLLASEGTRNALDRDVSTGKVKTIFMEQNANVRATDAFLRSFIEKGDTLVLEGMNETAMKRPDRTSLKNHTRTHGHSYVDIQDYSKEEALDILQSRTILQHIAALTRDEQGKSIGQVVSSEEMKEIKHELSQREFLDIVYPEPDFDDSIKKQILRKLFFLLK